jgi:bifunctional UDP-N-acetylglucosamine pyrophosphorylase / glucosamine-1-phosphate N-acetyltransferase
MPKSPNRAPRSVAAVVLAAGLGKRLKSRLPKVLHDVCGRPVLWHVLQASRRARPARVVVVVGHGRKQVEDAVRSWDFRPEPVFVDQGEPLGTGHAVLAAEGAVGTVSDVLVMAGDDPLVSRDDVAALLRAHRRTGAAASILTTELDDPTGYGRVVREGDELVGIVEETDAPPRVRAIREVSTLVYAFRAADLFAALPLVDRENRQGEYYLPEVLAVLKDKGEKVAAVPVDFGGGLGVNSRGGLAAAARIMRSRINAAHMASGVTLVDPDQTYIDVEVRIGRDTVIHPMTFLEKDTRIGADCTIGPSTRIVESRVGDGARVEFSVVVEARVGKRVTVGPFAYLRPGADFADGAKAGSFVEIKKSRIGKDSKVPHLAYVGDATVGRNVNIGAATVTVNYDGWDKHVTVIEDDVKIGSDTMLVAPVKVGRGAMTGAGSVVTRDVPPGALAIERSDQRNIEGYRKRKEAEKATRRAKRSERGH